jgi:hypothetical protein
VSCQVILIADDFTVQSKIIIPVCFLLSQNNVTLRISPTGNNYNTLIHCLSYQSLSNIKFDNSVSGKVDGKQKRERGVWLGRGGTDFSPRAGVKVKSELIFYILSGGYKKEHWIYYYCVLFS